ncbi:MAG: hypothetical protein P4L75_07725 [Clostridia bacterium]|nr:hypothetical protein [Clostridia bacterium]MDR3645441.1 hypothetical protein [Clostridia bacterium]
MSIVVLQFLGALILAAAAVTWVVYLLSKVKHRAVKYLLPGILLVWAIIALIFSLTDTQGINDIGLRILGVWLGVSGAAGLAEAIFLDSRAKRVPKQETGQ